MSMNPMLYIVEYRCPIEKPVQFILAKVPLPEAYDGWCVLQQDTCIGPKDATIIVQTIRKSHGKEKCEVLK